MEVPNPEETTDSPVCKKPKTENSNSPDDSLSAGVAIKVQRMPKRKCVAMLMSYYGKDYFGLQVTRNSECPGIEDIFCKILADCGLIKQEDYVSFG